MNIGKAIERINGVIARSNDEDKTLLKRAVEALKRGGADDVPVTPQLEKLLEGESRSNTNKEKWAEDVYIQALAMKRRIDCKTYYQSHKKVIDGETQSMWICLASAIIGLVASAVAFILPLLGIIDAVNVDNLAFIISLCGSIVTILVAIIVRFINKKRIKQRDANSDYALAELMNVKYEESNGLVKFLLPSSVKNVFKKYEKNISINISKNNVNITGNNNNVVIGGNKITDIIVIILALAILFAVIFIPVKYSQPKETFNSNGLIYELNKDGKSYSVTGIGEIYGSEIVIESAYRGKPITVINEGVFSDCSGLTSVTIPDGVITIGKRAFYGCSGLTSITIPDSVTTIGDRAFYGCSRLTSIIIPDSVISIGDRAFEGCDIINATIPTTAIEYIPKTNLTTVVISSGDSIGDSAFANCYKLTSISIPSSVTNIGDRAFYGCSRLTSITLPNDITTIGTSAFEGCNGLTSITISDSVISIGERAFEGCNIVNATIPTSAIEYIPKTNLETVIITSGESIGERAFEGCNGLTSITISDSVISIGERVFEGCDIVNATIPTIAIEYIPKTNLTAVVISSGESIGAYAFYDCASLTSITITDSVTSIGDEAFDGCRGLTSITIPDSVLNIGTCAFFGCSSLVSITIPDSVTSIGWAAFSGCSSLKYNEFNNSLYLGDIKNPYNILVKVKDTSITSCTINERTRLICYCAFYNCSSLVSITIPDSVTSIGDEAFDGCRGLTSITIPNSVTSIGYRAFDGCRGLTSIAIPNSVTSIGYEAFSYCSGLTSITIPDSVTSIGSSVFSNCSSLISIIVESGNTVYHSKDNCLIETKSKTLISGFKNSVIPTDGSVTSIGDEAFWVCSGLTSITIPNSVTSIGKGAFGFCSGLTSITIPDRVTSISDYAFYYCKGLTSITIPDSVKNIGSSAFSGCRNLKSVTIPKDCTIYKDSFPETCEVIRRT